MKPSSLCTLLAGSLAFPTLALAERRDTGSQPFNLLEGTDSQDAAFGSPASALQYTTSGGNPYVYITLYDGYHP